MTARPDLVRAVRDGRADDVRRLLAKHPTLRADKACLNNCLRYAKDHVPVLEALVEAGADINAGEDGRTPEGAINRAVENNATRAVRWMLARGAKLNHEVDGERRCFALTSAVIDGDLEMVKLLVEHGADYNAVWRKDSNALSFAMMYGQSEIETYLRSIGAKEPHEIVGDKSGKDGRAKSVTANRAPAKGKTAKRPAARRKAAPAKAARRKGPTLIDHIREQLGEPRPLSLANIVSGDSPARVHVVPRDNGTVALVTSGMSDRPMKVPRGRELFRFGELVMFLPGDWPHDTKALRRKAHAWPFQWMHQVAAWPHETGDWLRPAMVIDCGGPLAPGTRMCCLLAVTEDSDFGKVTLDDGRTVVFHYLTPLYPEERDLERREGTDGLLELFNEHDVGKTVDMNRVNVALPRRRKR